jgi:hypothetical protein
MRQLIKHRMSFAASPEDVRIERENSRFLPNQTTRFFKWRIRTIESRHCSLVLGKHYERKMSSKKVFFNSPGRLANFDIAVVVVNRRPGSMSESEKNWAHAPTDESQDVFCCITGEYQDRAGKFGRRTQKFFVSFLMSDPVG